MNYHVKIIRKPVKHLRIKVVDHQNVHAIAPKNMPLERIQSFITSKNKRIIKHLKKIEDSQQAFQLQNNQILLHGHPYTCVRNTALQDSYTLDHKKYFVRRGHDLTDNEKQLHRYKTYAKNYLTHRLDQLSHEHGISYNKCFIRSQTTKRGTCSTKGNIGLNRKLVKMPTRISDYVICHELAHLTHMNHSQDFRDHCTALYPKTIEAKKRLKQYGKGIR